MNFLEIFLARSITLFTVIPLLAFLVTLFWKNKQERPIVGIVQFTKAAYIFLAAAYAIAWIINRASPLHYHFFTIYQTADFVFAIQFFYDGITAVFSLVGAVLFFLVSTFSRYYMHRDEGYKRFFNTILLFALGYNIIIFSGNFETLFIGWEIIGLSSFLLIAFYRSRYLPVKNAFKVLSNYRVSDVALMLAMWMMHHLTHLNINFTQLADAKITALQNNHPGMVIFIVSMILLAAMIKSAQFPFTSWLPRAMEGPTSSSAIFYGSLSVHIGVFLLLRTYPFWQDMFWFKVAIIVIGVLTGIIATLISGVQPTVKTQLAYSSAAQIGLIFIEVALGFHILALIHFAGNAFLRTYQLLVSPSVLNYLVHHQYFHYHPPQSKPVSKWKAALYILSIKEWNLDSMLFSYLWSPFKWIGGKLQWNKFPAAAASLPVLAAGPFLFTQFNTQLAGILPIVFLIAALSLILYSFSYRGSAINAWSSLLLAHIFILSGVIINSSASINPIEILFYTIGIFFSFIIGYWGLFKIKAIDNDVSLNRFHGYVYEQKNTSLLFLIGAIGMLGFPVTTAFIAVDVFFTYVHVNQPLLMLLLSLCFVFIELSALRIFIRIFLGPDKKTYHPVAFRST